MSLQHILLGMLQRPASGYQIKTALDELFNLFWAAELSQIYRTLKRMEHQRLLSSRTEPSDKGPDRRTYRRTRSGRRMLQRWLDGEPELADERLPYLAQVFFLSELGDPEQAVSFLEKLKQKFVTRLDTLRTVERAWRTLPGYPDDLSDEDFCALLVLQFGLARTRAAVNWANGSIRRLRARSGD